MKHITLALLLLLCCSCSIVREDTKSSENTQSQTIIKNDVILEGEVAGMPVKLKIKHTGTEQTKSDTTKEESKDTSSPAADSGMGWVGNLLLVLLGGGGIGAVINKVKNGTIARISQGIDSYIEEDAKAGEKLKSHLSKKMDRSDKNLIKKVKDKK